MPNRYSNTLKSNDGLPTQGSIVNCLSNSEDFNAKDMIKKENSEINK